MSKILSVADIKAAQNKAKTKEDGDALIAQILISVEAQGAEFSSLQEGFEAAKISTKEESDALNSAVAVLEANNEALNASLAEAEQEIAELGAQLSTQAKQKGSTLVISHNKKKYKIIGKKFHTAEGVLTDEQLSKNKKVYIAMIENGSGALEEIKDENE